MRHVWTLIAAVVIAPLAWLLLAFGQDRSTQAFLNAESAGAFDTRDFIRPVLCLAAAGLVLGLIGTLRLSPLGAVLTGGLYCASYLALLVNPDRLLDLLPHAFSLAGRSADLTTPLRTGTTLMLGALLLLSIASVGRWRRWPGEAAAVADLPREPSAVTPSDERPLGAQGLGLTTPARSDEPTPSREAARSFDPTPSREVAWSGDHASPREPSWAGSGWTAEDGRRDSLESRPRRAW